MLQQGGIGRTEEVGRCDAADHDRLFVPSGRWSRRAWPRLARVGRLRPHATASVRVAGVQRRACWSTRARAHTQRFRRGACRTTLDSSMPSQWRFAPTCVERPNMSFDPPGFNSLRPFAPVNETQNVAPTSSAIGRVLDGAATLSHGGWRRRGSREDRAHTPLDQPTTSRMAGKGCRHG